MTPTVRRAATEAALADALAVRRAVFVDEQGVPPDLERDAYDDPDAAVHLLAADGDRPVGAARVRPYGDGTADWDAVDRAKVERVAVLPDCRGAGVGTALTRAAEDAARDRGVRTAVLHAQRPVEGFYAALGYRRVGEPFEEAGIPHVRMVRDL